MSENLFIKIHILDFMKYLLTILLFTISMQLSAQESTSPTPLDSKMTTARQYLTGLGKPKDRTKAMQLYLECAQGGNVKAMNMTGYLYSKGIGIKQNKEQAVKWLTKAAVEGNAESWYHLGMIYKEDQTGRPDYRKAYEYFKKSADLGNELGVNALAYMHYKGLGCQQDYKLAALHFKRGALIENKNSMYFLGLCYRNGYGVSVNLDSATYWLNKSATKGYISARNELNSKKPENSNENAKKIAQKIKVDVEKNAQRVNSFEKVDLNVPHSSIEGRYVGYIVKYDWSGKHAIGYSILHIDLKFENGILAGIWKESDSLVVPFKAEITPTEIVFSKASYKRADHYSNAKLIQYDFERANLVWNKVKDSIQLTGFVQMFSPQRNEPEKPLFIYLTKSVSKGNNSPAIDLSNKLSEPGIKTYPNPFSETLTLEFKLESDSKVNVQLLSQDGKVVYSNMSDRILDKGYYKLPLKVLNLPAGTYLLKLQIGQKIKSVKVVKQ
jgi:TPR repeat protein